MKFIDATDMGFTRGAATLALENGFRTPTLELKCLGTSFGGAKQKLSNPRGSPWPPCWEGEHGDT